MIDIIYKGLTLNPSAILMGTARAVIPADPSGLTLEAETFSVDLELSGVVGEPSRLHTSLGDLFLDANGNTIAVGGGIADLLQYEYGEPIQIEEDGQTLYEFYLERITKIGATRIRIEATGPVGRMVKAIHGGGIYEANSLADILEDICTAAGVSIDTSGITATNVSGWLPRASCRDNLQKLMQAFGFFLRHDPTTGEAAFYYDLPTDIKDIPDASVYLGGTEEPVEAVGKLLLTDHDFVDSEDVAEAVLYDNTQSGATAAGDLIVFTEPVVVSSLRAVGLTVTDATVNSVKVTGVGQLYGRPYLHIQRVLTEVVSASADNEVAVSENTVLTPINSQQALLRLADYYKNARRLTSSIVFDGEKNGDIVRLINPFGERTSGLVGDMGLTFSGIHKDEMKVAVNWRPTNQGSFKHSVLCDTTGVFSLPAEAVGKPGLIVIFGGGQGGHGGEGGEDGHIGSNYFGTDPAGVTTSMGGAGGEGGQGGAPGKRLSVSVPSLSASYSVTIGQGGAGGAEGTAGALGTATLCGSWSSASGVLIDAPYLDTVTGSVYGEPGEDGARGGDGGQGGGVTDDGDVFEQNGTDGGSAGYTPGGSGSPYSYYTRTDSTYRYMWHRAGAGGGGAAYGTPGEDATPHPDDDDTVNPAGDGASPAQRDAATIIGSGGDGGHGAGGGGGSPSLYYERRNRETRHYNWSTSTEHKQGSGGTGGTGGDGAPGGVLFFY